MAVMCLDREGAGLNHLPFEGGFLEQPFRTMQAIAVVQEAFADRLRREYEQKTRSARGKRS
jgi:hypothetical protein